MEQNLLINGETLGASQEGMLAIELYLITHYLFRRNVLNSKVEFAVKPAEGQVPQWKALTQSALNSIIIRAKRDNACDGGSPKSDIVEYVNSDEIDTFDPIADYLEHLPKWDGENQVAKLFHRLPIESAAAAICCGSLAANGYHSWQRMCANADWCSGLWEDDVLCTSVASTSSFVLSGSPELVEQV